MPTAATISPMANHIRLPVMKLPGIRFNPCPANTPPMITAITPMVMKAMRPRLLFTVPNIPSTTPRRGLRWVRNFAHVLTRPPANARMEL